MLPFSKLNWHPEILLQTGSARRISSSVGYRLFIDDVAEAHRFKNPRFCDGSMRSRRNSFSRCKSICSFVSFCNALRAASAAAHGVSGWCVRSSQSSAFTSRDALPNGVVGGRLVGVPLSWRGCTIRTGDAGTAWIGGGVVDVCRPCFLRGSDNIS